MKLFSVLLGARNTPASGRAFTRKDDRLRPHPPLPPLSLRTTARS
jgi:hypothetical protein